MTEQAQNALLKILEEPPAHLCFILTCENRAQMLSTIRSRAVCVSLGPVDPAEAAEALRALLPGITPEEAAEAASVFGGVIGQALQGLSEGSFRRVVELAPLMARAVAAPTELPLLELSGRLEKEKELADGVLGALGLLFRDATAHRFAAEDRLSTDRDTAAFLAGALSKAQLFALMGAVSSLQEDRRRNVNYTLFLSLLCSRLRAAAGK